MPYSKDLRMRVLEAVDGGMSKMQAHRVFRVSRVTIDRWLLLREQTGGVEAKTTYRRGRAATISDLVAFETFAQRHQSCTLAQMAVAWEAETGVRLTLMPFSYALRRIGYTRKKRAFSTPSAMPSAATSSCSS